MKRQLSLIITVLCLFVFSVALAADDAEIRRAIEMYESGQEITEVQRNILDEINYDINPDNELDNAGGPDLFGYYFVDSESPEGPEFDWVDITGTGTEVAVDYELGQLDGDGCIGPFDIGFDFTFYGEVYDEFRIQATGAISFFNYEVGYINHQLPYDDYGSMICWFWDDLNPDEGEDGLVYYELRFVNDQPAMVVSFIDYYHYYEYFGSISAQVILFLGTNRILIQYQNIDEELSVNSSTVGIQGVDGTVGLNYSYNGNPLTVYEGLAVEFLNDGPLLPCFVNGSVTDINTGDPLPGVEVRIGVETTTSDENGVYNFNWHLPGFEHPLLATVADYYDYHDTIILDMMMNLYDIEMAPHIYVDVSGYVTDSVTGDPIVGAEVSTVYTDTVTNEDGYYELINAGLIDSTYDITVGKVHYYEYTGQVSLPAEMNEHDVQLDAIPYTDFTGYVYDTETGGPVSDVSITIGDSAVVSGADGYYGIQIESDILYDVIVLAEGYPEFSDGINPAEGPLDYPVPLQPYPFTYIKDFEAGPADFEPAASNVAWEYGQPVENPVGAYSPSNCWVTHLDAPVEIDRIDSLLVTADWTIYSESAYVSYWHWVDYFYFNNDSEDGYNLKVSNDDGLTWDILHPVGGYNGASVDALENEPGWTGVNNWQYVRYELGDYLFDTVMFMFRHGAMYGENHHGTAIDNFIVYSGEEPDLLVEVDLIPVNPPFIIPFQGGTFQFGASATNNSPFFMNFDIWTMIILTDGTRYGPILMSPPGFGLPGETTIAPGPFTQEVPGFAPSGNYAYEAYVGSYANDFIYCSDRLEFNKQLGLMEGAGYNTWDISGWDFEIEGTEVSDLLPREYATEDVYPNPFNPVTNINIALPNDADLKVDVYNVNGQLVTSLANGRFNAGYHNLVFDGANLSSGLYFIRATVPGKMNVTKKVILVK